MKTLLSILFLCSTCWAWEDFTHTLSKEEVEHHNEVVRKAIESGRMIVVKTEEHE